MFFSLVYNYIQYYIYIIHTVFFFKYLTNVLLYTKHGAAGLGQTIVLSRTNQCHPRLRLTVTV